MAVHLQVSNVKRIVADRVVVTGISFDIKAGEILFIRGPSGVGKSLLLRSLACLDQTQGGTITLNGRTPEETGYPAWRAQVCYSGQSRVNFKGTATELYFQAQQFASQKGRQRGDLPALIHGLGLEQTVLNQPWAELSGGQAQRVSLAIAIALRPAVLLLDEPTSACDPESVLKIESVLKTCGCALVWVSHDPLQPARVGGRMLELPLGNITFIPSPPTAAASLDLEETGGLHEQ